MLNFRYVPSTFAPVAADRTDGAVAYTRDNVHDSGKITYEAMGFRSDRQKNTDFHFRFPTPERRAAYVAAWFANLDKSAAVKADRKAKIREVKAKGHPFAVGTLLYNSWGYEQTNIDFYQVVAAKGDMVTLRRIGAASRECVGWEQHKVKPARDAFLAGEPIRKRVQYTADGHAYISAEFGAFGITTEDRTHHETSYA